MTTRKLLQATYIVDYDNALDEEKRMDAKEICTRFFTARANDMTETLQAFAGPGGPQFYVSVHMEYE